VKGRTSGRGRAAAACAEGRSSWSNPRAAGERARTALCTARAPPPPSPQPPKGPPASLDELADHALALPQLRHAEGAQLVELHDGGHGGEDDARVEAIAHGGDGLDDLGGGGGVGPSGLGMRGLAALRPLLLLQVLRAASAQRAPRGRRSTPPLPPQPPIAAATAPQPGCLGRLRMPRPRPRNAPAPAPSRQAPR
jgi:hypothetical protein